MSFRALNVVLNGVGVEMSLELGAVCITRNLFINLLQLMLITIRTRLLPVAPMTKFPIAGLTGSIRLGPKLRDIR
jgi:hypothetical protein